MVPEMPVRGPTLGEAKKDMTKWVEKVNYMVLASAEGDCPQILKIMVLRRVCEAIEKDFRKKAGFFAHRRTVKVLEKYFDVNVKEIPKNYGKNNLW